MTEWILVICLGLIALLAILVAVLWFQLWLTRRDARILHQLTVITPAVEPRPVGGCLGSLLGWAVLLVLVVFLLAAFL